jgi:SAM-dependent methyltransferase
MSDLGFLHDTRSSYDAMAVGYAARFAGELPAKPMDRAVLTAFAALVTAGPVADVGCGPGRVTAFLRGLGLDVFGVDLSPGMVAHARREHPGLRFEVGSMTALDLPDAVLGGLNAWYSTIHVPDEALPGVFAEFHRVLRPDAPLSVAFQVGDEVTHYSEAFGHQVSLDFHRRQPDAVAELLVKAGFHRYACTVREPVDYDGGSETRQQACLIARKPA